MSMQANDIMSAINGWYDEDSENRGYLLVMTAKEGKRHMVASGIKGEKILVPGAVAAMKTNEAMREITHAAEYSVLLGCLDEIEKTSKNP